MRTDRPRGLKLPARGRGVRLSASRLDDENDVMRMRMAEEYFGLNSHLRMWVK